MLEQSTTRSEDRTLPPATERPSAQEAAASPAPTNRVEQVGKISGSLELLIEKPGFTIRQKDVPPLDPATEEALIARYQKAASIKAKFSIMRVLAFGGSERSIPLMTNALLGEFRGKHVTREEAGTLLDIPTCLGILGHREPLAVEFLWQAKEPGVIQAENLWQDLEGFPTVATVQGRCITGLGFSGRADVRPYFDHWWLHPEEVAARDFDDAAIRDALCFLWSIDRHGWDKAMDEVLCDIQRSMGEWRAWRASPDGQAWCVDWGQKVAALRSARRTTEGPTQ